MDLIYRYDPFAPIEIRRPVDGPTAIKSLLDGNRRLVNMVRRMQLVTLGEELPEEDVVPVNPVSMGLPFWPGAALDQKPFAMVLGCSDARVPLESVFDQSFNGMFVVRVAGNVLGTEGVGSFDYAVRNLGHSLQAVVVLGHTGCGAVTAAVDAYLAPNEYADIAFTHSLQTLVGRVMIAVRGAAKTIERRCGTDVTGHPEYRATLIDVAVYLNSALQSFDLSRQIEAAGNSTLPVHYGVCDLKTMLVSSIPVTPETTDPELGTAPLCSEEFVALADRFLETLLSNGMLS